MQRKIIQSNFIDCKSIDELNIRTNHYMLIEDDYIVDLVDAVPAEWRDVTVNQYLEHFVIPGFVDIHTHVAQFNNRGLGTDMQLLDWLETYTFPEESRFAKADYHRAVFKRLINQLWKNGTLSSVVFSTIHKDAAIELANLIEQSGLRSFVGKVNMDRNSPDYYIEKTADSVADTLDFVTATANNKRAKPIITPRFVPSCSADLMAQLGKIAADYDLPVQSHLSENKQEITWVSELFPDSQDYSSVYADHGLLRPDYKTIMAHCVWLTEREKQMLKERQVVVAHCPQSNGNLSSGIAPIAELLEEGIPVALGSDISGGHDVFMGRVIQLAIIYSNLHWVHVDAKHKGLTLQNGFYMATRAGGKFFGNIGDFAPGRLADFLVIDDSFLADSHERDFRERLQRFIYCGDDRQIAARFVGGKKIELPFPEALWQKFADVEA